MTKLLSRQECLSGRGPTVSPSTLAADSAVGQSWVRDSAPGQAAAAGLRGLAAGWIRPTRQLMLYGLGSLLVASIALLSVGTIVLRSSLDRQAWEHVQQNVRTAWHMLHEHGSSAELRGGRLFFGDLSPDGQSALIDELHRVAGGTATVFQGDLRIATNLLNPDGSRGVGTRLAPGPVYDAVVLRHESLRRKLRILGTDYYAAYDPIDDAAGHQIGVLCVDLPQADTLQTFAQLRHAILVMSAVLILVASYAFLRIGRAITRGIERDEDELREFNARFDAALGNMSQGLTLYDAQGRLAVVNRRFFEIFDLPPHSVQLGMRYAQVLAANVARGHLTQELAREKLREMSVPEIRSSDLLTGDRVIAVAKQPLPTGGWVCTYEDVTTRRRAEERSAFLAWHDPLTGLPNRSLLRERLSEGLSCLGPREDLAVLLLDLDNFKMINDTLGHPVGDQLLQDVAERLRTCVQPGDAVARLGGDEFAVMRICRDGTDAAIALAQDILDVLRPACEIDGHQVDVGASLGISLASQGEASVNRLLRTADLALYAAKADGRGVYRLFAAEMEARLLARRTLERDLRRAVAENGFDVFYQPLYGTRTGRIVAFEALVRWPHPERGMISPAEFIPLAEETGLITLLGSWVLRRACAEAANWPDDIRVAVNLSPAQFRTEHLLQDIEDALVATGLSPGRLELEITESTLMTDNERIRRLLHGLHELGPRIVMDDFGTGYSSLSYLRSFPFDKLKIDRSFIADLTEQPDAVAIIRAITQLADSLGMDVVAEGVETEQQLRQLRDIGVDEVQGYLLSRPVPASKVQAVILASPALTETAA